MSLVLEGEKQRREQQCRRSGQRGGLQRPNLLAVKEKVMLDGGLERLFQRLNRAGCDLLLLDIVIKALKTSGLNSSSSI